MKIYTLPAALLSLLLAACGGGSSGGSNSNSSVAVNPGISSASSVMHSSESSSANSSIDSAISSSLSSLVNSSVANSISSISSVASSASADNSSTSSEQSSESISSTGSLASSSSSPGSSNSSESSVSSLAPSVFLLEPFDVDKETLFSAAYQSISTDASAARYVITGGGSSIEIINNQLTFAGARFTIGHRPPRTNTTSDDSSPNGDFDLTRPYRISFTLVAASGDGRMQVYVDNSTTSQGNSVHGSNSKVFEMVAADMVAGQVVVITPTVGTVNSFIALRTESSTSVTIDDLKFEYLDGLGVSSSSSVSSLSSSPSSSSSPGAGGSSSFSVSSASVSSAVSSLSSVSSSSSASYNSSAGLSNDCINIATNPNINWRDTSLKTDQEIVKCLSDSLGKPVGYGENARGGYDAGGNSKLTIITKSSPTSVEQQILDAIADNEHNWIVFDKFEFADEHEIGLYRAHCGNATVQSILDASEAECIDYKQWCARKGFNGEAQCLTEFFNEAMNDSSIPIRIPVIGSNKTIDGRMSNAFFRFSGFAIGKDSSGAATQTSTSVIVTHLDFRGAGHTEDHYVDPDMVRATGESHDIWIHKNTFDLTGDAAFDVKVGAYDITISFNRVVDVLRSSLHGSSDSRTINEQITTTMHHNAFVTTDARYLTFGNTGRRVPLVRRGRSHMVNNLFVNYRKDVLSIRVGARVLHEDNMFVVNESLSEKSSIAASLTELQGNLIKDIGGGSFRGDGVYLWFSSADCTLNEATKTPITAASGTVANFNLDYSPGSQALLSDWRFDAGQDLANYVSAAAGKGGQLPFNSPLAVDRDYVSGWPKVGCQ